MGTKQSIVGAVILTALLAVAMAPGDSVSSVGDLEAVYKRGEIRIVPDPEFGAGTDWSRFIETEHVSLTVAPNGSLFLAQQRAHAISKFDRRFRNIVVTTDGLYGIFVVKGSPDDERRLIRVAF